jgi:hypothetical protein
MSKKINIKFELNYDLEDLRFMVGEDFPEEQFMERVTEQVWHDFTEMYRSDGIDAWADVEELND